MPNQPAADKEILGFQVPRTLKLRIQKLAAQRGEAMSETIVAILTHAVKDISLTPDDYRKIAEAIEKKRLGYDARSSRTGGAPKKSSKERQTLSE